MSSFLVSHETVNIITTWIDMSRAGDFVRRLIDGAVGCGTEYHKVDCSKLGQALHDLNVKASRMQPPTPYAFVRDLNRCQLLHAIRAAGLWLHQCHEPGCAETPLYEAMERAHYEWCKAAVRALPEYDRIVCH